MSKENEKAFHELAEKEGEVVAAEHGLPFTMEDWIAVEAESKISCSEEELSEDLLSAVSGGTASWVSPNRPRP